MRVSKFNTLQVHLSLTLHLNQPSYINTSSNAFQSDSSSMQSGSHRREDIIKARLSVSIVLLSGFVLFSFLTGTDHRSSDSLHERDGDGNETFYVDADPADH